MFFKGLLKRPSLLSITRAAQKGEKLSGIASSHMWMLDNTTPRGRTTKLHFLQRPSPFHFCSHTRFQAWCSCDFSDSLKKDSRFSS
jgi:hypothetical protein